MARRRGWLGWVLVVAFIVVPLVEVYVLIQVGQVIGVWWTILLLVADSILGTWLIRREGGRAWRALQAALSSGRMPAKELADGRLHDNVSVPFVLAGARDHLTTGRYLKLAGEPHQKLLVSICQAMGLDNATFGDPSHGTGPLAGLT